MECKYCELDVKHKEYGDHVDACGSRADYCELCGQRVMLKDMDEHKMAKCASVRAESPVDQHTLDNLEGLTKFCSNWYVDSRYMTIGTIPCQLDIIVLLILQQAEHQCRYL